MNSRLEKDVEYTPAPEDVPNEDSNILKFKNRKRGNLNEEAIDT
jgi:hypothetical protein